MTTLTASTWTDDYFVPVAEDQRDAVADRALKISGEDVVRACEIANAMHPNDDPPYGLQELERRKEKLSEYRATLAKLMTIPICEQRSEEWYAMRQTMITASDFAQAVGRGKFGTKDDFIVKKVDPSLGPVLSTATCPPLAWGVMFEQVVSDVYARKFACKMHEFGLVPHPGVGFIGASPDAITDDGIMVEIKAPYKRKITGQVPMQYYFQIQGQLEVCGLDACDYIECKFELVSQDVWQSLSPDETRGIIVEIKDPETGSISYVYSETHADMDAQLTWLECDVLSAADTPSTRVHRINFWRVQGMFVCRIRRDPVFWADLQAKLKDVWDVVLEYRGDNEKFRREMVVSTSSTMRGQSNSVKSRRRLEDVVGFLQESYGFTQQD